MLQVKINPRFALLIGICCVSIFPVLVKVTPVSEVTSAFYRLAISAVLFFFITLFSKSFQKLSPSQYVLVVICGFLFASDIAVWNIAINLSTATQASLLTNLAPVWVGIGAYFFLKDKPRLNFWIGTLIALFGMVLLVGWEYVINFSFDEGFVLAIISSIIYAVYIILSKRVLNDVNVLTFMSWSMISAGILLFIVSFVTNSKLIEFSNNTWLSLIIQGVICQFVGWLCISFSLKNMRANRVSLSLLLSVVFTGLIAWAFIDEEISFEMIVGGVFVLIGIAVTFKEKQLVKI